MAEQKQQDDTIRCADFNCNSVNVEPQQWVGKDGRIEDVWWECQDCRHVWDRTESSPTPVKGGE